MQFWKRTSRGNAISAFRFDVSEFSQGGFVGKREIEIEIKGERGGGGEGKKERKRNGRD